MPRGLRIIGGAVAAAIGIYGAYVAITYVRFGRISREAEGNLELDQLMPTYEVRERHSVAVSAPAEITLSAAREVSFQDSPIARTIFALRALPGRLRGVPPAPTERRPVFEEVTAIGWQELVETPGRQVKCAARVAKLARCRIPGGLTHDAEKGQRREVLGHAERP